jgi:glycerate kinase
MTRVLIAPDSFKGSLPATAVARALADGWLAVRPDDDVVVVPLADGGEGTLDAIEAAVDDTTRHDVGQVVGPDGRPTRGEWLELPDGTAVVELAQMSGLPLMQALDAFGATTVGLGQVVRSALEFGAPRLVIALGGSASTDGGAGALFALGLAAGFGVLDKGAGGLANVDEFDRSALLAPPPDGVILLTDVDAPLLGPRGAAATFAPQKGASPADVAALDAALARFAAKLGGDADIPGSGAAGGTAFGFSAAWGAEIVPGADYIAALSGLEALAVAADVVLTGEGRFDETSSTGKLVGQVIRTAARGPARVGVIGGSIAVPPLAPDGEILWSRSLIELAGSLDAAMTDTAAWLRVVGAEAAAELG